MSSERDLSTKNIHRSTAIEQRAHIERVPRPHPNMHTCSTKVTSMNEIEDLSNKKEVQHELRTTDIGIARTYYEI